ncbi:SitI3 family protein [Micromonospora sp. NPDC003197]
MSIDYELTLASHVPLEELAKLVAPGATEGLSASGDRMLCAYLYDEYGYAVSILAGTNGYYEAEDSGTQWLWKPETYVDIAFHMRKDTLTEQGRPHMLRAVAIVLANRPEDAALTLNYDWLLLTRFDGKLRKHNVTGWNHEDFDETYIS